MVTAEAGTKIAGYTYQLQRALRRLFSSVHGNILIGVGTGDDVVERSMPSSSKTSVRSKRAASPIPTAVKISGTPFTYGLTAPKRFREQYGEVRYCRVITRLFPNTR